MFYHSFPGFRLVFEGCVLPLLMATVVKNLGKTDEQLSWDLIRTSMELSCIKEALELKIERTKDESLAKVVMGYGLRP